MAKIAVESAGSSRNEAPKAGSRLQSRILATGPGWSVAEHLCSAGPRDRVFEERHSDVTIAIVMSGSFQYRGALGRELMTPGSLMLGNVGQYFECGHEHGFGDRCLSFHFSEDYFEAVTADLGRDSSTRVFKTLRLPPLRTLSPVIARACAALRGARDVAWEELGVMLAGKTLGLAREGRGKAGHALPSELARATRAVRMIEREADGKLPLAMLARQAGLSPYHFLRSFQKLTGLTPHQYVRRGRLRDAAARLVSGAERILDVALDCGFGDVSNFNHAFRAEFGCSPRVYRRGPKTAEVRIPAHSSLFCHAVSCKTDSFPESGTTFRVSAALFKTARSHSRAADSARRTTKRAR